MSAYILEMKDVTKSFPGVKALKHVNLQLRRGEILGICGENGAGKSTLMKVLSGSFSHSEYEGEIIVDGEVVRFSSVADAQKYGIEMVYQEINVIPMCTVAENMFVNNIPGKGFMVDYRTLYANTRKMLEKIGLDVQPQSPMMLLNSGQMQMVSLMRAYIKNPKVLVLDEPTSALTDNEVDVLMSILNELRDRGVSCIYISHKLEEVYRICDRVMVMRDGETINVHEIGNVTTELLIEEMIGRKVENLYPKQKVEIGGEIMRVEGVTIRHPTIEGRNIVEDVSFTLHRGEVLGIGGLVGSGRSEILETIFGIQRNGARKRIFIDGQEVRIDSPSDAMKAGIGFITEERKKNGIIWMLSIRENISAASLNELPGRLFINRPEERKRTQEIFDALHIKAPSVETPVVSLSGGNQQKVVVGKWLLKDPRILLVDEPTRGIDVGAKAEIYKLMNDLTEKGISIIMVSSDMPELINMSDRCLVISNGRITGQFEGADITDENVMRAAIAQ